VSENEDKKQRHLNSVLDETCPALDVDGIHARPSPFALRAEAEAVVERGLTRTRQSSEFLVEFLFVLARLL
jgi:hypothetical protein